MSTFIPIDRASIRRNKRAGQVVSFFPGVPSLSLRMRFNVPDAEQALTVGQTLCALVELAGGRVSGWGTDSIEADLDPGMGQAALDRLTRDMTVAVEAGPGRVREGHYSMDVPKQPVHHAPIPTFSFKHVPTEVACGECGARFLHTELQSEESDDGEWYSARVCPKCGAFECCDLEYERLTDAMTAGVGVEAEA